MMQLVLASLLLGACVGTEPSSSSGRGSFVFRPGVVVDPGRGAAYLMHPTGGIDALDLASGEVLWHSDLAARPLGRWRDRLVAQVEHPPGDGSLRVALLSAAEPSLDPRFVDVPLPEGVRATVVDGLESSFDARTTVRDGTLELAWSSTSRPATGAPPGPDATPQRREGRVTIDPWSASVAPIAPRAEQPPAAAAGAQLAGGAWLLVERLPDEAAGDRVRVRRWDAEAGEGSEHLVHLDRGLGYRCLSTDGRHLLASGRSGGDARRWRWVVYSLESGAPAAEVLMDESSARFALCGARLLHETNATRRAGGPGGAVEPARLHAVDARSGTESWSRPFRATEYRGPSPP